jgi:hypothetical protein
MTLFEFVKEIVMIYNTMGHIKTENQKIAEVVKVLAVADTADNGPEEAPAKHHRQHFTAPAPHLLSPVPNPISPVKDNDPQGMEPPLPPSTPSSSADEGNTGSLKEAIIVVGKKSPAGKFSYVQAQADYEAKNFTYCMWGFQKDEIVCGAKVASEVPPDPKKKVPLCVKCNTKKTKNPFLKTLVTAAGEEERAPPRPTKTAPVTGGASSTVFFGLPQIKGVPILNEIFTEEEHVAPPPATADEDDGATPSQCKEFTFLESVSVPEVVFLCKKQDDASSLKCLGTILKKQLPADRCECRGGPPLSCKGILESVAEIDPSQEDLLKDLTGFGISVYHFRGEGDALQIV